MTARDRTALLYLFSKGFTADDYRQALDTHRERAARAFTATFSEHNGYLPAFSTGSGYSGPVLLCERAAFPKAKAMSPVKLNFEPMGDGCVVAYPIQQWVEEETTSR